MLHITETETLSLLEDKTDKALEIIDAGMDFLNRSAMEQEITRTNKWYYIKWERKTETDSLKEKIQSKIKQVKWTDTSQNRKYK